MTDQIERIDKHVDALMDGEAEGRATWIEKNPNPNDRYAEPESASDDEPVRREPQQVSQQPVQRPVLPDFHRDPTAHFAAATQALSAENQQLRQGYDMILAGQQIAARADEFQKRNPAYKAAAKYFLESEKHMWKQAGHSDAEIAAGMEAQIAVQAMEALRRGKDPAELIYAAAQQRGFDAGHALDGLPDSSFDELWKTLRDDAVAHDGYQGPGKSYAK